MDSEQEDVYYSSGDGSADDMKEEFAEDGGDEEPDCSTKKHYTILNEETIRRLQETYISEVASFFTVSRGSACTLLCRRNWSLTSIYDAWFVVSLDERPREPGAMLPKGKSGKQVCNICLEKTRSGNMVSAGCGHPFCADCWKTYISESINDGPGCLTLPCPEPTCKATVGLDMVDSLAYSDDKDKYYQYLHRSYVECNRNRKWCPAPGCDLAIEFDVGKGESYDVTCDCSHKFCWKCTEESHSPVDCRTAAQWLEKNSSEAENTTWILAYTKPCPKCKRPIEKNQGCKHMRCGSPCGFEFCWECLGPWKDHTDSNSCNKYKGEGACIDVTRRMNAKVHLERYIHYYQRWDYNDKSRKRALLDLNRARNQHVDMLAEVQRQHLCRLQFVTNAWEQIVECMRVLKWTYAYGYFLSLEENSSNKINLFEFLQGQAEAALDRLHHCAETEIDRYLHSPQEDFVDFRTKLADLTMATRDYFENFVRALEDNLSEVSNSGTKTRKSSKNQRR